MMTWHGPCRCLASQHKAQKFESCTADRSRHLFESITNRPSTLQARKKRQPSALRNLRNEPSAQRSSLLTSSFVHNNLCMQGQHDDGSLKKIQPTAADTKRDNTDKQRDRHIKKHQLVVSNTREREGFRGGSWWSCRVHRGAWRNCVRRCLQSR
jgi:hypothetical protein